MIQWSGWNSPASSDLRRVQAGVRNLDEFLMADNLHNRLIGAAPSWRALVM